MARALVIAAGLLTLTACGEGAQPSEATPAEKVSAANPASDAEPSVPAAPTAADLRRICRAGLAAVHGQTLDAIEIGGLEGQVVNASWRAPVDGGRRRAQCRVDGDLITWKPLDRPTPTENRWMNQSGDPVVRFVLDGATVVVTQTLPDGTVAQAVMPAPAEAD